jgi:hypothetical protein
MQISDTDPAVLAQKLRVQKPLPEHMHGTDDMTLTASLSVVLAVEIGTRAARVNDSLDL